MLYRDQFSGENRIILIILGVSITKIRMTKYEESREKNPQNIKFGIFSIGIFEMSEKLLWLLIYRRYMDGTTERKTKGGTENKT